MANITLGVLRDFWKNISDWVKGTDGESAPQVTLSRKKSVINEGDYTTTLDVDASGSSTITIEPPEGEFWRIKMLRILVPKPTGASIGTHGLYVQLGTSVSHSVMDVQSLHSDPVEIFSNEVTTATYKKTPSTSEAQVATINNLVATHDFPLRFWYFNNTNVSQSNDITILITREVEYIVG